VNAFALALIVHLAVAYRRALPVYQGEEAMTSGFQLFAAGLLGVALTLGTTGCSADRDRASVDHEMESADRMVPDDVRRHDAQESTGAAADPVRRGASADRVGDREITQMDRQWAMKTAQNGIAEVELGRLAQEKGSSAHVKDFGRRMVEDHSKANDELKAIASRKGIDLPAATDAKHKAAIDRLSKMSGVQFDRAYIQEMRKEHKHDVAHFEKGSNSLHDADLKSFAANTLPKLREHLKQAQEMNGRRGTADRSR
jgi:putative membrane protein